MERIYCDVSEGEWRVLRYIAGSSTEDSQPRNAKSIPPFNRGGKCKKLPRHASEGAFMKYSFLGLSRRTFTVIALTAAAMAVSACSTNTSSSTSPVSDRAVRKGPLTYSWSQWVKVAPFSGDPTEVTGINNLIGSDGPQIVGFYTVNSTTYPESFSFISKGPSYSTITYASYPVVDNHNPKQSHPKGTQMNAIETQASGSDKDLPVLAGWADDPGQEGFIWPVVDNQGLWALESNGTDNVGTNFSIGELFGINSANIAVGYTAPESSGMYGLTTARYFLTGGGPQNVPLNNNLGQTSQSIAYGINDSGDMVGTATLTASGPVSWYALCVQNCPTVGYAGSGKPSWCWKMLDNGKFTATTTAYGISGSVITGGTTTKMIVGSYVDGSETHGFLVPVTLTSAGTCETGTFQEPIDAQSSNGVTVVLGINNLGYIVGYYKDQSSKRVGFVGIPTGLAAKHRRKHQ